MIKEKNGMRRLKNSRPLNEGESSIKFTELMQSCLTEIKLGWRASELSAKQRADWEWELRQSLAQARARGEAEIQALHSAAAFVHSKWLNPANAERHEIDAARNTLRVIGMFCAQGNPWVTAYLSGLERNPEKLWKELSPFRPEDFCEFFADFAVGQSAQGTIRATHLALRQAAYRRLFSL